MNQARRVAIIGAGVTGLAAAQHARAAGAQVCVMDAGDPGGLAAGFAFPGVQNVWLEKFYHHLFRTDSHVVDWINQNGQSNDLMWRYSRTGLFSQGRIWPLESASDLLRCKPIGGFLDRLRLGLSMRIFQKTSEWRRFDTISCEDFFRARNCHRAYKNFWEPLLKAKFGDDYPRIPAAFLWGRIYPRSRSREKGKESLGYLRGGFARMIQGVVQRLQAQGVQVLPNTRVEQIRRQNGGFAVQSSAATESFDRIIWTGHPQNLTKVLENPEPALVQGASRIRYIGACCMVLLMNKSLSDFYWVNNVDPSVTFGGCIEHTNLVPREDYGGLRVAYLINYIKPEHPYMALDVEALFEVHRPSLQRFCPHFDPGMIVQKFLFKSPVASPLYDLGFAERMPPFFGWSPGIGLLGMPQVYPIDRNMNHCIEVALQCDMNRFLE